MPRYKARYKICVSGGAKGDNAEKALPLARRVGRAVAKKGHVLITGATTGVSYAAAEAAKKAGGDNIGFSPAGSAAEHVKKYRLPLSPKVFDHIIYAEAGYGGRNLLMVRSADATVVIDGRIGTLHEFTAAYEEGEVVGVLAGSGGTADEIPRLLEIAGKGLGGVIFEENPEKLVDLVIAEVRKRERKKT